MSAALALLSSLLWGSADFTGGLLSRRLPSALVVGCSQACGLVAVTLAAVVTRSWVPTSGWLGWAVLSGLVGSVGLVCFYTALSIGTMGVVSPIAALGAVVPVLIGVAQGERPAMLQVVGIVVALAGVVAASGPEVSGAAGARPVILACVAGVGFGLALTFINLGSRASALLTLAGMRATSVACFMAAGLVVWVRRSSGRRNVSIPPSRPGGSRRPLLLAVPVLAAIGVADAGANLAFGVASTAGLVSLVAVLGSLYPVVTVVAARFLLAERLGLLQQVGVVAALAGVALIAAG